MYFNVIDKFRQKVKTNKTFIMLLREVYKYLLKREINLKPFQDGGFLRVNAYKNKKKMPIFNFLFIKRIVGILPFFRNSQ